MYQEIFFGPFTLPAIIVSATYTIYYYYQKNKLKQARRRLIKEVEIDVVRYNDIPNVSFFKETRDRLIRDYVALYGPYTP